MNTVMDPVMDGIVLLLATSLEENKIVAELFTFECEIGIVLNDSSFVKKSKEIITSIIEKVEVNAIVMSNNNLVLVSLPD